MSWFYMSCWKLFVCKQQLGIVKSMLGTHSLECSNAFNFLSDCDWASQLAN